MMVEMDKISSSVWLDIQLCVWLHVQLNLQFVIRYVITNNYYKWSMQMIDLHQLSIYCLSSIKKHFLGRLLNFATGHEIVCH
jgi:hypothetical protein